MKRPVALLALATLSWSQLTALRCDMRNVEPMRAGEPVAARAETMSMDAGEAMAMDAGEPVAAAADAEAGHHHDVMGHTGAPHALGADDAHDGPHRDARWPTGCRLMMTCGTGAVSPSAIVALQAPAAPRADARALPFRIPAGRDLATDPPPPRDRS